MDWHSWKKESGRKTKAKRGKVANGAEVDTTAGIRNTNTNRTINNQNQKPMKNITELRTDLAKTYDALKTNKISFEKAAALGSMAGKILSSCGTELEYNKHMKRRNKIAFLEG